MTTTEFKKYFKNLGIPIRARKSKHFINLWIEPEINFEKDFRNPLVYKYEFPLDIRVKLLKSIYSDVEWSKDGNAGNIRPYSLSFTEQEWQRAGIMV